MHISQKILLSPSKVPGRSRAFRYSHTIISSLIILIYSLAREQRLSESQVLWHSPAGNLETLAWFSPV